MRGGQKFLAAALAAALAVLPAFPHFAAVSAAEGTHTVAYSVRAFSPVTREVAAGDSAPALTVADLHRGIDGSDSRTALSEAGLKTEWFTDEALTRPYSFGAVNEDTVLYGKVTQTQSFFEGDVFGWNRTSGITYVGEPALNEAVSGEYYSFPLRVDEESGEAEFSFFGGGYSVYGVGFDVSEPFSVSVDFGDVGQIYQVTIFDVLLYPNVTFAQAGSVYGHQNGGAAAALRFWADGENAGKAENTNSSWEPSPETMWCETGGGYGEPVSPLLREILLAESAVTFTFEIGEEGGAVWSGDTKLADLQCTRADFPDGYAYLSVGSETGADVTVRPAQAAGAVSFSAEGENVSVRGVEAKNGYLIAEADVAEGCTLAAKLGEEELQTLGLGEGRYAVSLPRYMTEAFSVTFSAESGEEEEDPAGGCGAAAAGGYGAAGSIGIAAVAAASFAVLKRRKHI